MIGRRPRARHRSILRDDRGAAVIEMALVMPILLMVLVGIAEFGIFFTEAIAVASAAHNGARYASVHPTAWSSASLSNLPANTIEGQALLSLPQSPSLTIPNDDAHINITYSIVDGSSTPPPCGHYSVTNGFVPVGGYTQATCVVAGSMIQVTVTYTYRFWAPGINQVFLDVLTFSPTAIILEEV